VETLFRISREANRVPLTRPWKRLITVGRAYELLRTDLRRQLDRAQREIGWEYCRFHALFHDDMAVVKMNQEGHVRYQWRTVEEVYDTLLDVGLRPFVELNPMPKALASGDQTIFWYGMNVTPPKDYDQWEDLVETFARRCLSRYGRHEIRKWYFELWNEPNLPGFWAGNFVDYMRLYEHTVAALKRIDPHLRVGGPATAGAAWIPEFLNACAERGLPADFVSTHRYPQDAFTPIGGDKPDGWDIDRHFDESFETVQQQVRVSPFPDAEIHWTEWNCQAATGAATVSWGQNRYVESSYAASFIARHCIELDSTCDSMGWWALSDIFEEAGPQLHPFNCGYGLLSVDGLAKASYNAFRFLREMEGDRLGLTTRDGIPDGCGAVATFEDGVVRVLIWNHPRLVEREVSSWNVRIESPGNNGFASVKVIAPGNGSPVETWQAMGCPHTLTRHAQSVLEAASQPKTDLVNEISLGEGCSGYALTLEPWSVALLEWSPAEPVAIGKGMQAYGKASDESGNLESLLSGNQR
jgi:xylan 1,4-beta-xylosidase